MKQIEMKQKFLVIMLMLTVGYQEFLFHFNLFHLLFL